jgi:hypothetical protein
VLLPFTSLAFVVSRSFHDVILCLPFEISSFPSRFENAVLPILALVAFSPYRLQPLPSSILYYAHVPILHVLLSPLPLGGLKVVSPL